MLYPVSGKITRLWKRKGIKISLYVHKVPAQQWVSLDLCQQFSWCKKYGERKRGGFPQKGQDPAQIFAAGSILSSSLLLCSTPSLPSFPFPALVFPPSSDVLFALAGPKHSSCSHAKALANPPVLWQRVTLHTARTPFVVVCQQLAAIGPLSIHS